MVPKLDKPQMAPLLSKSITKQSFVDNRVPNPEMGNEVDLLIMRPHPENTNNAFLGEDLVHQTVLDIDSPGIGSCKIPNELLVRGRALERIVCEDRKQILRF